MFLRSTSTSLPADGQAGACRGDRGERGPATACRGLALILVGLVMSAAAFGAEIREEFTRAFSGLGIQRIQLVFRVAGEGTAQFGVFAQGPSLAAEGVEGFLPDPRIELLDAAGQTLASNNDWQTDSSAEAVRDLTAALGVTLDPLDAAMIRELGPGTYTLAVTDTQTRQGITRAGATNVDALEQAGEGPVFIREEFSRAFSGLGIERIQLIFRVKGEESSEFALFAQGPSLAREGVEGFLPDPIIQLIDTDTGAVLATNDNWQDHSSADQIRTILDAISFSLDDRDAAMVGRLPEGSYTLAVTGVNNTTGITRVGASNVDALLSREQFTIGGEVTGLTGAGLVLQNNGADDLAIDANGTFTFGFPLDDGTSYAVTVATQPAGQTCSVANGTGTVSGADVTDVLVTCADTTFTVGGTVTGLTGDGLVLQNNGTDDLAIPAGATGFTFPTALADGSPYSVTIAVRPSGQGCAVSNATGTVAGGNVTDVAVSCGALSGLGLFGTDSSNPSVFSEIDEASGAVFPISVNGLAGRALRGVAYDPGNDRIWATDVTTLLRSNLMRIDPATGVGTEVALLVWGPDEGLRAGDRVPSVQGLTFDPVLGVLYGIPDATPRHLIRIDTASGECVTVTNSTTGLVGVRGVALDPSSGNFYFPADGGDNLYLYDPTATSGQETRLIGPFGSGVTLEGLTFATGSGGGLFGINVQDTALNQVNATDGSATAGARTWVPTGGLAYNADADNFFAVNRIDATGALFSVARTGESRSVGSMGYPDFEGMAYDPASEIVYGIDRSTGTLVRIDPTSGETVPIGGSGFTEITSLAFDSSAGVLYGYRHSGFGDQLIRIDPGTGAGTNIGTTENDDTDINGLAFVPAGSVLYGIGVGGSAAEPRLYTIDRSTGNESLVGSITGMASPQGLSFDGSSGTLYATDAATRQLYVINRDTAAATPVGATSGLSIFGLTFR